MDATRALREAQRVYGDDTVLVAVALPARFNMAQWLVADLDRVAWQIWQQSLRAGLIDPPFDMPTDAVLWTELTDPSGQNKCRAHTTRDIADTDRYPPVPAYSGDGSPALLHTEPRATSSMHDDDVPPPPPVWTSGAEKASASGRS